MKWENGRGVSTKLCSHRADRGRQRGQREGEGKGKGLVMGAVQNIACEICGRNKKSDSSTALS